MIKNKNLMIKKLIEYKKEKDLKEKINKGKPYTLRNTAWLKKDKEKEMYDLIPKSLGWSMKYWKNRIWKNNICISSFRIFN